MPVKKIPSTEVSLGMFISSLDRPWTETPFLFQGFMVRNQEEINDLKRLTKFVYIAVPDEEIELHEVPDTHQSTLPPPSQVYTTTPIEQEIKTARESHHNIASLVGEIHDVAKSNNLLKREDIEAATKIMVTSVISNPDAYVWLTSIKKFDTYIYRDALMASVWATALGRELGMTAEQLNLLSTGTLLMDIGKTTLPPQLLHTTSRLSHAEWEQMKSHVEQGLHILEFNGEDNSAILDIVRSHHERIDGSGYPDGLRDNQIPLMGQIAGLVDFYVAVTNPRPFAKTIAPSKALQMLYQQKGKYFNPDLVEAFIRVLGTYPTGSLVELDNGEVAIVYAQDHQLHLKPKVVLLLDPDKQPYHTHRIVSLADYTHGPRQTPVSIAKSLPYGSYGISLDVLSL
jgi:HD-GYP domain-containing protein (c-di-GMP phosphodiesterase class II)